MGIEHHLLRLARIGPHEQHPAVAKPDMGDLHDHRHAAQHDDFMAPVELVGLAVPIMRRAEFLPATHLGVTLLEEAWLGPNLVLLAPAFI
jgi:hypothetical protein